MTTSYIFTLEDVFYKKFPESSMKKLLAHCTVKSVPLRTKVSLGDIALQNSPTEAWWCTRILPNEARVDVIKCIIPTIKRLMCKNVIQPSTKKAVDMLEKVVNGDHVLLMDLRSCANNCTDKSITSIDKAIAMLVRVLYEMNYTDTLMVAMAHLENNDTFTTVDGHFLVNDICAVFPPLSTTGRQTVSDGLQ